VVPESVVLGVVLELGVVVVVEFVSVVVVDDFL